MELGGYRTFLKEIGRKDVTINAYTRIIFRFSKEIEYDAEFNDFEKKFNKWLNSLPMHQHLFIHKAAGRSYSNYLFGKKIDIGYVHRIGKGIKQYTITQEQYKQLIFLMHEVSQGHLLVRNLALVEMFISTGLKVSVVSALNVSQIDFKKGVIQLGDRNMPILEDLGDRLKAWLNVRSDFLTDPEESDSLFISRNGKRMKNRLIQHTLESISLPGFKISPEILRHTFAKWVLEITEDKELVRRLLHVNNSQYLESHTKTHTSTGAWSTDLYLYKKQDTAN